MCRNIFSTCEAPVRPGENNIERNWTIVGTKEKSIKSFLGGQSFIMEDNVCDEYN